MVRVQFTKGNYGESTFKMFYFFLVQCPTNLTATCITSTRPWTCQRWAGEVTPRPYPELPHPSTMTSSQVRKKISWIFKKAVFGTQLWDISFYNLLLYFTIWLTIFITPKSVFVNLMKVWILAVFQQVYISFAFI